MQFSPTIKAILDKIDAQPGKERAPEPELPKRTIPVGNMMGAYFHAKAHLITDDYTKIYPFMEDTLRRNGYGKPTDGDYNAMNLHIDREVGYNCDLFFDI